MDLNFPIEGALFDMDGLLLDTERLFMQGFVELTRPLEISTHAAQAFFETLVGTSSQVTTARLVEFLPDGVDVSQFDADWRALHRDNVANGVPVKHFVPEILSGLRNEGVPMAVVTSTHSDAAHHHLKKAGLFDFFDAVVAGDDVSANKPDPEPYVMGASRIGVDAKNCAAFEDSDLGTQAATRAGCHTYQIPDLRPKQSPLMELGQFVVKDLQEAADHLWGRAQALP
ncbi:HAD family hydrolase [Shimia sp. Alg240-R146]|uniref:HAD family hydrolase n=1 Tax=Shimia sp. Alg240-R146 TaxID=2993449 RepID=UPI0022E85D01|nr:HAD family phosphatase [Shimia sp. Alg240-R146]